jgi:hypothetical protein
MPDGALWLTDVGSQEDPKPADWLWQYPTDTGKGGMVFMHNGDNMVRYPDHGAHKHCLVRDILRGADGPSSSSWREDCGTLPRRRSASTGAPMPPAAPFAFTGSTSQIAAISMPRFLPRRVDYPAA